MISEADRAGPAVQVQPVAGGEVRLAALLDARRDELRLTLRAGLARFMAQPLQSVAPMDLEAIVTEVATNWGAALGCLTELLVTSGVGAGSQRATFPVPATAVARLEVGDRVRLTWAAEDGDDGPAVSFERLDGKAFRDLTGDMGLRP